MDEQDDPMKEPSARDQMQALQGPVADDTELVFRIKEGAQDALGELIDS